MTTYRNESLPRLAYLYAKASIDQDAERMNAIASELRRKDEAVKALLAACHESVPWVATAMAYRRDKRPEFDAHPDAVKNHEKAVSMLQAAIAKAEGKP